MVPAPAWCRATLAATVAPVARQRRDTARVIEVRVRVEDQLHVLQLEAERLDVRAISGADCGSAPSSRTWPFGLVTSNADSS